MTATSGAPTRTELANGDACGLQFYYTFGKEDLAECEGRLNLPLGAAGLDGHRIIGAQWAFLQRRFGFSEASGRAKIEHDNTKDARGGDALYEPVGGSQGLKMLRSPGAGIWLPVPRASQVEPVEHTGGEWRPVSLSDLAPLLQGRHRPHDEISAIDLAGILMSADRAHISAAGLKKQLAFGVLRVGQSVDKLALAILEYYGNCPLRRAAYDAFMLAEKAALNPSVVGSATLEEGDAYFRRLEAAELVHLRIKMTGAIWLPIARIARRVRAAAGTKGGAVVDISTTALDSLVGRLAPIEAAIGTINKLRDMAVAVVADAQGVEIDLATLRSNLTTRDLLWLNDPKQQAAVAALDRLIEGTSWLAGNGYQGVLDNQLPQLRHDLDRAMAALSAAVKDATLVKLLRSEVPVFFNQMVPASLPGLANHSLIEVLSALAARYAYELANTGRAEATLAAYLRNIKAPEAAADLLEYVLALTKPPQLDSIPAVFRLAAPWDCAAFAGQVYAEMACTKLSKGTVASHQGTTVDDALDTMFAPFIWVMRSTSNAPATYKPTNPADREGMKAIWEGLLAGKSANVDGALSVVTGAKGTASSAYQYWNSVQNRLANTAWEEEHGYAILGRFADPFPQRAWPRIKQGISGLLARFSGSPVGTALFLWSLYSDAGKVDELLAKGFGGATAKDRVTFAANAAALSVDVMKAVNLVWRYRSAGSVFATETGAILWLGRVSVVLQLGLVAESAFEEFFNPKTDALTRLGDAALAGGCIILIVTSVTGVGGIVVIVGVGLCVTGTIITKRKAIVKFFELLSTMTGPDHTLIESTTAAYLRELNMSDSDVAVFLLEGRPDALMEFTTLVNKGPEAVARARETAAKLGPRISDLARKHPEIPVHPNYHAWFAAMKLSGEFASFLRAYRDADFSTTARLRAATLHGSSGDFGPG